MIDGYCKDEVEAQIVRSKTSEDFFFWMERKKKALKKQLAEIKKAKKRAE